MRGFPAILFFGVSLTASAAPNAYDIYVQACDGDCVRVVDVVAPRSGASTEINSPGINLRIDALSADADTATVRLSMNLAPLQMVRTSMEPRKETVSRLGFLLEPCTLRKGRYSLLGNFSGGGTIYQVWGRLTPDASPDRVLASR